MGLTMATARALFACGVDVITSGNHIWDKRELIPELDREERILRPLNYGTVGVPGRGWGIFHAADGTEVAVINAQGRSTMVPIENPFTEMDRLLDEAADELPAVRLVDFHCELTSEKTAFGLHLDGRVSAVVGTHTHVPTADERLLARGTAYTSDLGMTGPARQRHRLRARDGPAALHERPADALRGRHRARSCFNALVIDIETSHGTCPRPGTTRPHRGGVTTPLRNQVDLHTHTARSDGVLEPASCTRRCEPGARPSWPSPTTTRWRAPASCSPAPARATVARRDGPRIIVGVEINTIADAEIAALVPGARRRRSSCTSWASAWTRDAGLRSPPGEPSAPPGASASSARSHALMPSGLPVRDRLPAPPGGIDALGRPHVARALVAAGHATSVDDAFARYLDPGAAAYVRRVGHGRPATPSPPSRAAGGLPVLAHAPWTPGRAAVLGRLHRLGPARPGGPLPRLG